jgi:hypothetical protein
MPRQKKFNGTIYETLKVRGQYGGIDSCTVSTSNNFKTASDLLHRNEMRSLDGRREEIQSLHHLKSVTGQLDADMASAKVHNDAATSNLLDAELRASYLKGATVMDLHDCIKLQGLLDLNLTVHIGGKTTSPPAWPPQRTFVHPVLGDHGQMLAMMPHLSSQSTSTKHLWTLVSLLVALFVQHIWEGLAGGVMTEYSITDWQPNLLCYATGKCLPHAFRAICGLLEAGGLVNQLVNQLKSDSLGTPAQSPEPITNQLI